MLRNRRHVESNVFLTNLDKEFLYFHRQHGLVAKEEEWLESAWGEEELLKSEHLDIELKGPYPGAKGVYELSEEQEQQMHLCYMREDSDYADLWEGHVNDYVPKMSDAERTEWDITEGMQGGWDFNARALKFVRYKWPEWRPREPVADGLLGLTSVWVGMGQRFKEVSIEGVSFKEGDWFIARPNLLNDDLTPLPNAAADLPKFSVPKRVWAGKIKAIFRHERFGKQREPITENMLEVQWHESLSASDGGPFSVDYQSPVVHVAMHPTECPFFPARSVLPMKCTAMRALHMQGSPPCLVLIRRQWHSLGAVDLPVPWPAVR